MFLLNRKNCDRMKPNEKKYFVNELNKLPFKYLKKIKVSKIRFYWNNDMNDDNGVLGCFDANRDSVFLRPMKDEDQMPLLVDTAVHELNHYYMAKLVGPVIYPILNIPFIRELLLEPLARKYERKAEKLRGLSTSYNAD